MRGDASGNTDTCTPKSFISGPIFSLTDKDSFNAYISEIEFVHYIIIINVQKPSAGKYNNIFVNFTVNYTQNKYLF